MARNLIVEKPTLSCPEKVWIIFWETYRMSSHHVLVVFICLYSLLSQKIR